VIGFPLIFKDALCVRYRITHAFLLTKSEDSEHISHSSEGQWLARCAILQRRKSGGQNTCNLHDQKRGRLPSYCVKLMLISHGAQLNSVFHKLEPIVVSKFDQECPLDPQLDMWKSRSRGFRIFRVCTKLISQPPGEILSHYQRYPTGFFSSFKGVQCSLLGGKNCHPLQEGVRDDGSFRVRVDRHFTTPDRWPSLTYNQQFPTCHYSTPPRSSP
jgi:hypothetical protein